MLVFYINSFIIIYSYSIYRHRGNSIAFPFPLACLFICFSGISLAFLFVLLVFLCFACFDGLCMFAFLVSLLACFFFQLCVLLIVCDCFCALFGQCRTAKTAQRAKHSRTAARGTPGGLVLLCLIAFAIGAYCIIMRVLACRGLHHSPPGVLFRYGLREKISQIGLAHPPNLLF